MSYDDDAPIGRVLSRREVVRLLAASGAGVLIGCRRDANVAGADSLAAARSSSAGGALPACVAKPELTVGPYFVDKQLERSDIRLEPTSNSAKPGAPLELRFNVVEIMNGQCSPLSGAMVDVWQCDAAGQYSGVNDRMIGFDTVGQRFLRGYQVTDNKGVVSFTTIYPGWYQGRTVHIHFKIRTPARAVVQEQPASVYEFTSQLFFDDALTDRVHREQPYAAKGQRDIRNERDGIYRESGGVLMLAVSRAGSGYSGTFDVGLDLADAQVGRPDRDGGPGGRGRRGGPPPRGRP